MTGGAGPGGTSGLERLELRVERLGLNFRFTFAFHAREVRFECDYGEGFERIFPETFSFHANVHDPAELFIQLEDLLHRPELISPAANLRDSQDLVVRLLSSVPRYLTAMSSRLSATLPEASRARFDQDLALFCQIGTRFLESRDLVQGRRARVAIYHMRKLTFRSLLNLVESRVNPDYLAQYVRGDVDPVVITDDPTESGFFLTLETGEPEAVNRMVVRMAERAFFLWLDGICLDEGNQAFEKEDSPFDSREAEVVEAICHRKGNQLERGRDLVPFLRRPSKDCRRMLKKLEGFFLRRYDIGYSSALINHNASLAAGFDDGDRILTWHTPLNHGLALLGLMSPFVAAAFFYQRMPHVFDLLCATEVALVNVAAIWFLVYRFCWKRDLSFFYAAVPRIGAGIIVGYLPVFLIDEVWDLASQPITVLGNVVLLLGLVTLLYIYVEVQRRLDDTRIAFARARAIFVLGVLQAFALGIVMTGLVGSFMVERNWEASVEVLSRGEFVEGLVPLVGQLPLVIGVAPLHAFPSAVLVMTFLSFFIGVFLQLMWEELPITEPL